MKSCCCRCCDSSYIRSELRIEMSTLLVYAILPISELNSGLRCLPYLFICILVPSHPWNNDTCLTYSKVSGRFQLHHTPFLLLVPLLSILGAAWHLRHSLKYRPSRCIACVASRIR